MKSRHLLPGQARLALEIIFSSNYYFGEIAKSQQIIHKDKSIRIYPIIELTQLKASCDKTDIVYIEVALQLIMIRGTVIVLLLLAAFSLTVFSSQFNDIYLPNVERNVNLAAPYPSQIVKLTLHANQDGVAHFSYLIPLEYDFKINRISFVRGGKDRSELVFSRSVYIYNGESFGHYKVKLPYNLNIDEEVEITAQFIYLDRYVNLPKSISLGQDQKLQYEDIKFIVSPYEVQSQRSTYKYARIIEYDRDGQKRGLSEVLFKENNAKSFNLVRHKVFGINNLPQVKFTEVQKVVQVSHWGNVAITQRYKMVNTGPSLKGEFSRVTYGARSQSQVKNDYKGIEFDLPYEVWGLYYQDEVGNITTSKAWRDESSRTVHVSLAPRFSLLGGWKSNWQIGYNFKTQGLLFNSANKFELKNIKLQYALEKVLTQSFKITIVLPHGAQNVRIKIGGNDYEMSLVKVTSLQGYLDFNGRPAYVIDNFKGSAKDKHLQVYYDYPLNNIYEKPIRLFIIILAILLFTIFMKRFRLKAFQAKSE